MDLLFSYLEPECPHSTLLAGYFSKVVVRVLLRKTTPLMNYIRIFAAPRLSQHYLHHMVSCVKDHANVLPGDVSSDFPSYACLLGNLLEAAGVAITQHGSFAWAIDFAIVSTYLFQALPPLQKSNKGDYAMGEDDMLVGDELSQITLNKDLELQILNAFDPRFLLQLTNVLLGELVPKGSSHKGRPDDKAVAAVDTACSFLHVAFNIVPLEQIMTVLAYRTELVPTLWNIMKRLHENDSWSSLSERSAYMPTSAPGWLLPLAVFCPIYKHMLMIVDNEEFYKQEKPLSLKDIRLLIVILRQALWQIPWLNPVVTPDFSKSGDGPSATKRQPMEFLQHRLQDWNNSREFTSPSDFNAHVPNDLFMSQALIENTRANDILKQAPFLVPFTSRAKFFNIRITFVNEFGVEEAGIDGGGIFKDFRETVDYLLYPNPGSELVHEQHLQYFHFLGTILAKRQSGWKLDLETLFRSL